MRVAAFTLLLASVTACERGAPATPGATHPEPRPSAAPTSSPTPVASGEGAVHDPSSLRAPTLALAGGKACRLVGPTLVASHPRGEKQWHESLALGFGAHGGLLAYSFDTAQQFVRRIDAHGVPAGEAKPLSHQQWLSFKRVLPTAQGFLVLAGEQHEFDHSVAWLTDLDGTITSGPVRVPLGIGMHSESDMVGDRWVVATPRPGGLRVLVVTVSGATLAVDEKKFAIDGVGPGTPANVEVALSREHWAVVCQVAGQPHAVLILDGKQTELSEGIPAPRVLRDEGQTHRMLFSGDDDLSILGGPTKDPDPLVVVTDVEGRKIGEQGVKETIDVRRGTIHAGDLRYGGVEKVATLEELPAPFQQRVTLEVGLKQVLRMTQFGLTNVGDPTVIGDIDPPIRDALSKKWAWSGSHFVVAYPSKDETTVRAYTLALDCRR